MKSKEWTIQELNQIKQLYENGYSIHHIACEVFHCRQSTISQIIKENNYQQLKFSRLFTLKQEQDICQLYNTNNYTMKFIAEKYNVCVETVRNILIANNIAMRKNVRKVDLQLNENYFHIIDSPKKAYLLGFLFADGCVYKNQISLEIHYKDIEILHLFQQELNSTNKISYRKRSNTEMCCCRICSKQIVADLANYGIVPNKTINTKHLPNNIPNQYKRDFLRGLLDGDGWITKDKLGYYHIGFVNNYESVCQDFQNMCNDLIEHKTSVKITNKGHNSGFVAQFQSKLSVKQLATALYKDSVCYLTRKYILAMNIFESKDDEDIV